MYIIGPVVDLSAVLLGMDAIRVTWEAPSDDDGLVTQYQLQWPAVITLGPDVRSYVINSTFSNGTEYTIRVRAINVKGVGQASSFTLSTPRCKHFIHNINGHKIIVSFNQS